jgi:hypothetical protein
MKKYVSFSGFIKPYNNEIILGHIYLTDEPMKGCVEISYDTTVKELLDKKVNDNT